eukprot:gnl/MRDRNA2_/MRDRNA2_58255_c0_seq1.p1 gnl/MRDRNA2_/MRDRNA2_58255_c0~~gnl/MRDRNA2_/MRDRNA2_58255_c0_seq1.p1  ORF type:complete len:728 (+),score=138.76 gnl/MRDRNA2_/MRDRNA2_58255_c0_seq1:154-2184(+)
MADAKWVVVSYALLAQNDHLRMSSQNEAYKTVILDECHYIKNITADRSQSAVKACNAASAAILISGTAVLNAAWELHPMLSVLMRDPVNGSDFPDYEQFVARYFRSKEKKFGKIEYKDPIRETELNAFLHNTVMIRRRKADVLKELPPKRRMVVRLAPSNRATTMKLQQVESKLFKDEGAQLDQNLLGEALELLGHAKAESCCRYIEDLLEAGIGKFLLFAHHRVVLDLLEQVLQKRLGQGYIRIDGSTNQLARPGLVRMFQEDLNCHAALLSITALAEGQTLTSAECVIFAELSWTPGMIEQCEARAHRLGQKGSVLVQYLVLENSKVDDRCCHRLQCKHVHAGLVLDGVAPPVLLDAFAESKTGLHEAVSGTDEQGLRPKARARPLLARGAAPKSRALPREEKKSWMGGDQTEDNDLNHDDIARKTLKCGSLDSMNKCQDDAVETTVTASSQDGNEDGCSMKVSAKKQVLGKKGGASGRMNKSAAAEVVPSGLPEDAPPGHVAHTKVRSAGKNGAVAFTWKDKHFQTTVKACGGSAHAAEVIARACYLKFEAGDSKDVVMEFRAACYQRLKVQPSAEPSPTAASCKLVPKDVVIRESIESSERMPPPKSEDEPLSAWTPVPMQTSDSEDDLPVKKSGREPAAHAPTVDEDEIPLAQVMALPAPTKRTFNDMLQS